MKKTWILLAIAGLALTGAACNRRLAERGYNNTGDQTTANSGSGNGSPAAGNVDGSLTFDCTAAACPEISIKGDSYASSAFRGYADPTMRKDPVTGRLWLAYSWPNAKIINGQNVQGVETHLSYSDDGGKTWQFDKVLWPENSTTDQGGSGQAGYMDHEVANLLPVEQNGSVTWYAVRLDYFLPNNGGYKSRPASSFQLRVLQASSPDQLTNAPSAVLGGMVTASGWQASVNLAKLSSSLNKCQFWNEPALYSENGVLYLAARCMAFSGPAQDTAHSDFVVFSTNAQGSPTAWQWTYVGAISAGSIGSKLGTTSITQFDLAKNQTGQLMLIATPEDYSSSLRDYVHHGCVALEMASINPPSLAMDSSGNLKVLAKITASDSNALGPGACTYDSGSSTGIVMTRRTKNSSEFSTSLNATGIKP